MEISTVKQIIKDLAKKTPSNGCTEAEAMSAAKKIGELLKVYNLSIDEVFLANTSCVTKIIKTGRKRRHPIDRCCCAIAEFCDCKVWAAHGAYNFFGLESDTDMVEFLYYTILSAIDRETHLFKQGEMYQNTQNHRVGRKAYSVSFQKGMVDRIHNRLTEMTSRRKREEKDEEKDMPFFMKTDTSLVLIKQNKVESEYEKLSLRLRKAQATPNRVQYNAYSEGKKAGDKVGLSRPIQSEICGLLK